MPSNRIARKNTQTLHVTTSCTSIKKLCEPGDWQLKVTSCSCLGTYGNHAQNTDGMEPIYLWCSTKTFNF